MNPEEYLKKIMKREHVKGDYNMNLGVENFKGDDNIGEALNVGGGSIIKQLKRGVRKKGCLIEGRKPAHRRGRRK